MTTALTFLGIESSCDDTAAAVVRYSPGAAPEILSSVVEGQTALHAEFGGVVPEIAARAHVERLDHCVELALSRAGVALRDLDGIAVTAGPGLIGGVLSGVMLAKGLATATRLPLVGVNHLAGHALTPRLTDGLAFPYLMLLVSGGHCQFLIVRGVDSFQRLGGTIDDAPGEAFDKTAKLLGLSQPGGPAVEALAAYVQTAGLQKPAVIGHSMGGLSALMLAQRHPEAVGRVMAVDNLPFFSALFGPQVTPETARPFADQAAQAMLSQDEAAMRAAQEQGAIGLARDPATRTAMVDWTLASDRRALATAIHEVMTTDVRPGLSAMTTPVTVLYAADANGGAPAAMADARPPRLLPPG